MFENIKHDMYTNLKQTSFSWDKRDRINNMSPGIWTSWKHTARLYSISTVPWSQEGFYVIYLSSSGDATCFVLPSMQMHVWLCVCVSEESKQSWIHSSFTLEPLTVHNTPAGASAATQWLLYFVNKGEKLWPAISSSSGDVTHGEARGEVCTYEISAQMRSDVRMRSCQTQWHGWHNETTGRDGGGQMNRGWRAGEWQTILIETGTWWQIGERARVCVCVCPLRSVLLHGLVW